MSASDPQSVSIVILAAGRSSRLGRPKQLLDLGGEPLLRHVVQNALASRAREVVLVLGSQAEEIAAAVGELGQRTIVNPHFAEGQSTSLKAGIRAIEPGAQGVIVMLGDQPTVTPALLNQLISAFEATGAHIVQPVYGGTPGNPVLVDRGYFPELLEIEGDQGARGVIKAHRRDTYRMTWSDEPPPGDVDTDEDYRALLEAWNARSGTSQS